MPISASTSWTRLSSLAFLPLSTCTMVSHTRTRGGSSLGTIKVYDIHVPQRAADAVLSAVMTGINTYGTRSVTTVGHSLGAAISLLDAIFLPLHIPDLTVTHYGYGLPRVRAITKVS